MPYVLSKELAKDKIQVWYTTNIKNDDITLLDRSKPTVLLLHGMFLSTRFLAPQFADPRLSDAFNLVAFDALSCGRTKNPVVAEHDLWTDAALLAIVTDALNLPPFHIMANGMNAVGSSLKFAMLFKERCLSLMLVGIPGPVDLDWCSKAYTDILKLWSFAPSLDILEEACMEVAFFLFRDKVITDSQMDEVCGYWMQQYPPCRRTYLLDVAALISGRVPHTQQEYEQVTQPVFLVTGDGSPVHTIEMAEELQAALVNAKGGAKLQVIRGGTENLQLPQSFAGLVNRYLSQFVFSVESDLVDAQRGTNHKKLSELMKPALGRLAELAGDPSISKREAKSMLSFTRVLNGGRIGMEQFIAQFKKDENKALSPLDKNGQPIRKFSERNDNSYFLSPAHVSEV